VAGAAPGSRQASGLTRHLFELGARIAEAAENTPEIFDDSHWARYGAQVEFMDSLLATIESCDPDETVDTDKKGRSYSQIVRTCEDYTLNLEGRRPYMSELCATANVSERTLQNAFNNIMGMSPLTYLHRLRLHRARDELRKAKSGSTTVTDVAMNWGFWHFGEFSRAYKNCFGEVPSRTLKQNSSD
jgi:AraC-like DNA-binding protein